MREPCSVLLALWGRREAPWPEAEPSRKGGALELALFSPWALRLGLLVGLASGAIYWDLRARRVPDLLTFPCALAGLVIGGWERGAPGLLPPVLGFLVGGLLFLPFVIQGYVGAGDMKLLAAAGAFLGPGGAARAVLLGAVLGGAWALGWWAARREERWLPYAPPLAVGVVASFLLG